MRTLVTVPYVAPGPRAVELSGVPAVERSKCGNVELQLPAQDDLDRLARNVPLYTVETAVIEFHSGTWRLLRSAESTEPPPPAASPRARNGPCVASAKPLVLEALA